MIKQSRRASGFTVNGPTTLKSLGAGLQVHRHVDPRLSQYPFTLNFYDTPPPFELTLDEFELFSLDRLKLLKAIETAKLRCKKEEDVFKAMEGAVSDLMDLGRNAPGVTKPKAQLLYEQRRKDHISHFLLRLAFCRSEELRVWFTRLELVLFKFRYVKEAAIDREAFLSSVSLDAFPTALEGMLTDFYPKDHLETEQVQASHKARLMNEIRTVYSLDMDAIKTASFYKVPFEQVLELISRKAVLLKDGWAYVPESERILLVMNAFKSSLIKGLEETAKALPRMEEDDRLTPILNSIAKQHVGNEYNANPDSENVSHQEIDGLVQHFPPCMRALHYGLQRDSHLKHMGRLQYGLFLKGIGLPVEEALLFWRKAFQKKTDDEFQKNYAYNIRYNYGMEGARKNYAPYSCVKIITTNAPGTGDHHGCPFKHYSPDSLRDTLVSFGAPESSVLEIVRTAKDGHFQIACTRFFELTRGKSVGIDLEGSMDMIEHPNAWFDKSYRGLAKGGGIKGEDSSQVVEGMAMD